MDLQQTYIQIQELKKELDSLRPIKPEQELRIMQKFRLDWNFHSSHIEGNTLTYGETKAFLLHNITAGGKPLRDHLEISGHNEAILLVEDIIKQKRPLTESFIRELHKLLLREPYEVKAITPEGKDTTKMVMVGQYKTTPNHVKTKTGEIFRFAEPEETSAKMHDLMEFYNTHTSKGDSQPLWIASVFHYRFVSIHPFDDGNGRVARILMNFILMLYGYPPVIIKANEKDAYFRALQLADSGNIEEFVRYIGEQLLYSLQLTIKGAKGESIEETDDIDKKIALLKIEMENIDKVDSLKLYKNSDVLKGIYEKWIKRFVQTIYSELKKLDDFYVKTNLSVFASNTSTGGSLDDQLNYIERIIKQGSLLSNIQFRYEYKGLIKSVTENISNDIAINIIFDEFSYSINCTKDGSQSILLKGRPYHVPLLDQEITQIARELKEWMYKQIEANLNSLITKPLTIQDIFPGKWMSFYDDGKGGSGSDMDIEIKDGNKYYEKGKHVFNLEDIKIDMEKNKIKYTKVGVGMDSRICSGDLSIVELGKEYIGFEDSTTKIRYIRTE